MRGKTWVRQTPFSHTARAVTIGGGGGLKCDSTHSALASLLWPCIQLISFIASRSQRGNLESFNTLKHLKTLKHMKSCQVVYENWSLNSLMSVEPMDVEHLSHLKANFAHTVALSKFQLLRSASHFGSRVRSSLLLSSFPWYFFLSFTLC